MFFATEEKNLDVRMPHGTYEPPQDESLLPLSHILKDVRINAYPWYISKKQIQNSIHDG